MESCTHVTSLTKQQPAVKQLLYSCWMTLQLEETALEQRELREDLKLLEETSETKREQSELLMVHSILVDLSQRIVFLIQLVLYQRDPMIHSPCLDHLRLAQSSLYLSLKPGRVVQLTELLNVEQEHSPLPKIASLHHPRHDHACVSAVHLVCLAVMAKDGRVLLTSTMAVDYGSAAYN